MPDGIFISFEGGEGAGKSTQIARLADALRETGRELVVTREPGGSPGAEEVRTLLVTGEVGRWTPTSEALLHYAARAEHLAHTVRPALERGAIVITDRFSDSTMAYQGYAHGLGREAIEPLETLVVGETRPHLTLILDVPVKTGLGRAHDGGSGEDRYERMGTEFHEKLRAAFLDIAEREPARCVVIDAARTMDAVAEDIRLTVKERLGL